MQRVAFASLLILLGSSVVRAERLYGTDRTGNYDYTAAGPQAGNDNCEGRSCEFLRHQDNIMNRWRYLRDQQAQDSCVQGCSQTYTTAASCDADADCQWSYKLRRCGVSCGKLATAEQCIGAPQNTASTRLLYAISQENEHCFWDPNNRVTGTCQMKCDHFGDFSCPNSTYCVPDTVRTGGCLYKCEELVHDGANMKVRGIDGAWMAFRTFGQNFTHWSNATFDGITDNEKQVLCDFMHEGNCRWSQGSCKKSCNASHWYNLTACGEDTRCRVRNISVTNAYPMCVEKCSVYDEIECGRNTSHHCYWLNGACREKCSELFSAAQLLAGGQSARIMCRNHDHCDYFGSLLSNAACSESCGHFSTSGSCFGAYAANKSTWAPAWLTPCDWNASSTGGNCIANCFGYQSTATCNAVSHCSWDTSKGACLRKCSTISNSSCIAANYPHCVLNTAGNCVDGCPKKHYSATPATYQTACAADSACETVARGSTGNGCRESCASLARTSCQSQSHCVWKNSTSACRKKCTASDYTTSATCPSTDCQWIDSVGCTEKCDSLSEADCNAVTPSHCEWYVTTGVCRTNCRLYTGATACAAAAGCTYAGTTCVPTCSLLGSQADCTATEQRKAACMWRNSTAGLACVQRCSFMHLDATACAARAGCEWFSGVGCQNSCASLSNMTTAAADPACYAPGLCEWRTYTDATTGSKVGACMPECAVKAASAATCTANTGCVYFDTGICLRNCRELPNNTAGCNDAYSHCYYRESTNLLNQTTRECRTVCSASHNAQVACSADEECTWGNFGCHQMCIGLLTSEKCLGVNTRGACEWIAPDPRFPFIGACIAKCEHNTLAACTVNPNCQWFEAESICARKCSELDVHQCDDVYPRCIWNGGAVNASCRANCGDRSTTAVTCSVGDGNGFCVWSGTTTTGTCVSTCSSLTSRQCHANPNCYWDTAKDLSIPAVQPEVVNIAGLTAGCVSYTCGSLSATECAKDGSCEVFGTACITKCGVLSKKGCYEFSGDCQWNHYFDYCTTRCDLKYPNETSTNITLTKVNCMADGNCSWHPSQNYCMHSCISANPSNNSECSSHVLGCTTGTVTSTNNSIAVYKTICKPSGLSAAPTGGTEAACEIDHGHSEYGIWSTDDFNSRSNTGTGTTVCRERCSIYAGVNQTFDGKPWLSCNTAWEDCQATGADLKGCKLKCGRRGHRSSAACNADPDCEWVANMGYGEAFHDTACQMACSQWTEEHCGNLNDRAIGGGHGQLLCRWNNATSACVGGCPRYPNQTLCVADAGCSYYTGATLSSISSTLASDASSTNALSPDYRAGFTQAFEGGHRCMTKCESMSTYFSCVRAVGVCNWDSTNNKCYSDCSFLFNTSDCPLHDNHTTGCMLDRSTFPDTCVSGCSRHLTSSACAGNTRCLWSTAGNGTCLQRCSNKYSGRPSTECDADPLCTFIAGQCLQSCAHADNTSDTTCMASNTYCRRNPHSRKCEVMCSRHFTSTACAAVNCTWTGSSCAACGWYETSSACGGDSSCGYAGTFTSCQAACSSMSLQATCEARGGCFWATSGTVSVCVDSCPTLGQSACMRSSRCIWNFAADACQLSCSSLHGSATGFTYSGCDADAACESFVTSGFGTGITRCRERCAAQGWHDCQQQSHCRWSYTNRRCEHLCASKYFYPTTLADQKTACTGATNGWDGVCTLFQTALLPTPAYRCAQSCNSYNRTECAAVSDCVWASATLQCVPQCSLLHTYDLATACTGSCVHDWSNNNTEACAVACYLFSDGTSCGAQSQCVWLGKDLGCRQACDTATQCATAATKLARIQKLCSLVTDPDDCRASASCIWSDGVCKASCRYRTSLTAHQCRVSDNNCDVNSDGVCVDACQNFVDNTTCNTQPGYHCYWNEGAGACVKNCTQYATPDLCQGDRGCMWWGNVKALGLTTNPPRCVFACSNFRDETSCMTARDAPAGGVITPLMPCTWHRVGLYDRDPANAMCHATCNRYTYANDSKGCLSDPHCEATWNQWGINAATQREFVCVDSCGAFSNETSCKSKGDCLWNANAGVNGTCFKRCPQKGHTQTACAKDSDCFWSTTNPAQCLTRCPNITDERQCNGERGCLWDLVSGECRNSCADRHGSNATSCDLDTTCTWSTRGSFCTERCSAAIDDFKQCKTKMPSTGMNSTCLWVSPYESAVFSFMTVKPWNESGLVDALAPIFNTDVKRVFVERMFVDCANNYFRVFFIGWYDLVQNARGMNETDVLGFSTVEQRLLEKGIVGMRSGDPPESFPARDTFASAGALSTALLFALVVLLGLFL